MTPAWLRWYHGTVGDAKWRVVLRDVESFATLRDIVAVWAAMLEHASDSRPRGSIVTFDFEATAETLGWPSENVRSVFDSMRRRGLHDGERLIRWAKRNPGKVDATGAERQRRFRQRHASRRDVGVTDNAVTGGNAVTPSNGNGVTPDSRNGGDIGGVSLPVGGASSLPILDTSTSAATRASEIVTAEQVKHTLAEAGMRVGLFSGASDLAEAWIARGLTASQLADAIRRARASRARQGDTSPLKVRFVACFVTEVLDGKPETGAQPKPPTRHANGSSPAQPREDPDLAELAMLADRLRLGVIKPDEHDRRRAEVLARMETRAA